MELLRIISTLYILILHVCLTLGIPKQFNTSSILNDSVLFLFENFAIVGINCFVLISGYFSINFKVKTILILYLQCLFYVLLMGCINDFHFQGGIRSIVFALSESNLWFIPIYVGLVLVSPFLNKAADSLSKLQFVKVLILLTICNIYLGYLHQSTINNTGHTIMQFIYLYFIGRYIAIHGSSLKTKYSPKQYTWMYVGTVLVMTVLSIIRLKYPVIGVVYSLHYNSPFVLFASVLFFMIFASLKFRNRSVNYVASSALAVYLFHSTTSGWNKYTDYVKELQYNASGFLLVVYLALFVIAVFITSIVIDKLRIFIMNPIQNILVKISDHWENKIRKYIVDKIR